MTTIHPKFFIKKFIISRNSQSKMSMHETTSTPDHLKDGIIDLTSGTVAGMVNVFIGQPLDTVKLKMQTFSIFYKDWIHCFSETYRLDGIKRGLYSGTVPSLIANVAENMILFGAYGYCQKRVALMSGIENTEHMSTLQNALSGSMASFFSGIVLCPIELIKCRLQARRELIPGSKSTPFKIFRYIVKNEGISAFTKGMTATLARDVPGYSCFFGAYETTRYMLSRKGQSKDDIGLARTMVAGACSGVAFWTMVFPADVIKSMMQVRGGTINQIISEIIERDGIIGLYKGLTPTLIRTSIVSASLLAAYEYTKKFLRLYS